MTISTERTTNLFDSTVNNIYPKAQEFKSYISSQLNHYIVEQEESEKKISFTERELQEIHWNTMTPDGPVGIEEWEAYNKLTLSNNNQLLIPKIMIEEWEAYNKLTLSNNNQLLIPKIMNIWNKHTGLSYLSGQLEVLNQDQKVRLYTYTSKLLFKEEASIIGKTIQVVSSLFGITHLSLITTLLVNKLFPDSKKV